MRVLLVGDVHGQIEELCRFLARARAMFRVGLAIQVGDFGFASDMLATDGADGLYFPVPLHVIDGDHEDHGWLDDAFRSGRVEEWRDAHNLFFQPRPSVLTIGASKIGFLGGALHVDRPQEIDPSSGVSNFIQRGQREEAAQLFDRERPDLIVTHTCPAGIGIGMRTHEAFAADILQHVIGAGFDPGPKDDCGDIELTSLWRALRHRPRAWAYGHFHRLHQAAIEGTAFVCAPSFDPAADLPLVLWDTDLKYPHVLGR